MSKLSQFVNQLYLKSSQSLGRQVKRSKLIRKCKAMLTASGRYSCSCKLVMGQKWFRSLALIHEFRIIFSMGLSPQHRTNWSQVKNCSEYLSLLNMIYTAQSGCLAIICGWYYASSNFSSVLWFGRFGFSTSNPIDSRLSTISSCLYSLPSKAMSTATTSSDSALVNAT